MMVEPFPSRAPCFVRPPTPLFDPRRKAAQNYVEPRPVAASRWSWWTFESFDSKIGPKITVYLHIMHGHEEFEARYDVPKREYHERIVYEIPKPVTEHDKWEKVVGIWDEIADRMETWPELSRIVDNLSAYALDKRGRTSGGPE